MHYEDLAFFNEQLGAMLSEGIPLEAALKQLCAGMRSGQTRTEFEALAKDLSAGVPLSKALEKRNLPRFYRRMVQAGVMSNDLPAVLTMIADYYRRVNSIWTRLKGLLLYPLLVICVGLGLSLTLSVLLSKMMATFAYPYVPSSRMFLTAVWIPPIVLLAVAVLVIAAVSVPAWRARLRWRVPAFQEASLAQVGAALALMLRNGCGLSEALALAEELEGGSPAAETLARWRGMVESGMGKPAEWEGPHQPFPDLFVWMVQKRGEDLAAGFQKAADIYQARANYKVQMALYGALPISILILGQMVLWQAIPLFRTLIYMMNSLGDMS